ncbi:MAG: YhcH/YjgK/YiaL family protein [Bacteroidales bacterium]|nr:YhcH/YjgK/YiaL family protein [Bacteroidales bacterium]
MKIFKSVILLLSAVFIFNLSAQALSSNEQWTQKKASKWFKSREWANGMSLKADKSVNQLEFAKQYHKNKASWDLAFKWLKDNNPETVAPGKYVLDGTNVTVNVTDAASTMAFEKTKWEGHCKYIDIQYIARGKEKMGIAPIAKAVVVTPYNPANDCGFYNIAESDSKYIVAKPGTFLIFFPSDAHRPNIKVDGNDQVKKIVFKIKADTTVDPLQRQGTENKQLKNKK